MTIRIPSPSLADKFLRMIGKKRAIKLPTNMEKFGPHFQATGIKESFWKALARPNCGTLPEGTVDIFFVGNLKEKRGNRPS
jgi:hypothetical protein